MTFSTWIALALTVSLSASPDIPTQSIEQLVQTGTIALNDRRYAEAEAAWREVIRRDPKNFEAYLKLGDALRNRELKSQETSVRNQTIKAAKEAYQNAIALDPKRAEGYLKLAELEALYVGNVKEAIAIYRRAIDLAEPNAEVYYMLGVRLLDNPNNDRVFSVAEKEAATFYFRKATQVKSQDKTYVGLAYVALGDDLISVGKVAEGIAAYQRAMALNDSNAYIKYGEILARQNRLDEMVVIYQNALQKNPDSPHKLRFYSLLGRVLFRLNRLSEAEEIYWNVVALKPDSLTTLSTYFTLGDISKKQGKSDEALRLYQQAAQIRPDRFDTGDPAYIYYQIGEDLKERGLLDLAIATYRKAITELDPKEHYRPYAWLGRIFQTQGKTDEAFVAFRQSVRLNPYAEVGIVLEKQGKLDDAEKALRTAIGFYEVNRTGLSDNNKILLAETQAKTYQLLQKVLVLQNRTDEALEVAEQGRSRAFAEILTTRLSKIPIPDIEKATKSPNLDQIRSIAKTQNATLVEYSIIDQKQIYIWVIKPNGTITFKTSELKESVAISQLVADSRATIHIESANPALPSANVNQSLKQLYQTLITPIASDLPSNPAQPVIFLPQGELFLVPFPALQDPKNNPLIAKHTLSTAPSIQTLQLTHDKAKLTKPSNQNLVVGNPTMPIFQNTQLADLPGAKNEAIAIGKLLNTEPLLGNQATKAQVLAQMPNAAIIHLATHGLLTPINGDIPGAIALAPNGTDNGFLSAREIFDLKLTANLAVLSACDTGRGEITSDGVIGLSRSFIAAGVPSVIVSLWAVNDDSTNVLMSNFYRNLKTNPNKAQSLRQAMLTTMKQYPDPKYWAAFTLIGET
jgi:CHAT domain-containing protein/cytochrome c-type biogenesis protein CcmH/NrfG